MCLKGATKLREHLVGMRTALLTLTLNRTIVRLSSRIPIPHAVYFNLQLLLRRDSCYSVFIGERDLQNHQGLHPFKVSGILQSFCNSCSEKCPHTSLEILDSLYLSQMMWITGIGKAKPSGEVHLDSILHYANPCKILILQRITSTLNKFIEQSDDGVNL